MSERPTRLEVHRAAARVWEAAGWRYPWRLMLTLDRWIQQLRGAVCRVFGHRLVRTIVEIQMKGADEFVVIRDRWDCDRCGREF